MNARILIAAGIVAIGTFAAAVPASAASLTVQIGNAGWNGPQGHHHLRDRRAALSPQEVRRILRHRGYREIRYLDRQGSIYVARAEDRRGRDYRVVVSARTGAIIDIDRLGRRRG